MTATNNTGSGFRLPVLQGVLPIDGSRIPTELIAGLTLAALAIPEVMGYTKIAGTPVIFGLYTILIPMAAVAESAPTTRCREEPNSANRAIGIRMV